jgi:hypothetical protein
MKRKARVFAGTCISALLLATILSSVQGDPPRPGPPPARRVTIDGKSFLSNGTGQDDFSRVRREFEKFGAESTIPPARLPASRNRHPVFEGGVAVAAGSPAADPPPLPPGMIADHILRLETGPGSVDLVLGRMHGRGATTRHRLVADGWEPAGVENAAGSPRVLEKKTGKETAIVCLDEAEGTFLLFRESGR